MDRSSERLIGPWKRADVLSLVTVCREAQKLYEPIQSGLLASDPSLYPDIAAARKALNGQPVYRWLKREMCDVLDRAPDAPPSAVFRFVEVLVKCISIAFAEAIRPATGYVRTDKKQTAAEKAIRRVEDFIDDGTILISQRKIDKLQQLLVESRKELTKPRHKAGRSPALQGLAFALIHEFELADAHVITLVATITGLTCSDRTAERYIAAAAKSKRR